MVLVILLALQFVVVRSAAASRPQDVAVFVEDVLPQVLLLLLLLDLVVRCADDLVALVLLFDDDLELFRLLFGKVASQELLERDVKVLVVREVDLLDELLAAAEHFMEADDVLFVLSAQTRGRTGRLARLLFLALDLVVHGLHLLDLNMLPFLHRVNDDKQKVLVGLFHESVFQVADALLDVQSSLEELPNKIAGVVPRRVQAVA